MDFYQQDTTSNLKEGTSSGHITKNTEDSDILWPMFSSILNIVTSERNDYIVEKQKTDNPSTYTDEVIFLNHHIDPVNFLKSQQDELLVKILPSLTQLHKQYSLKGHKHLDKIRQRILDLIKELNQTYEALLEIYTSEQSTFEEKHEVFKNWVNRRELIASKIDEVLNNSPEGETYLSLQNTFAEVNDEITELEEKLISLKKKRKLISNQLLETKSLMDIKLNHQYNELEILQEEERNEINLLFKEKIITSNNLEDTQVADTMEHQIQMFESLITQSSNEKSTIEEGIVYLSDIFESLKSMEDVIMKLFQEGREEQVLRQLVMMRELLVERLQFIKNLKLTQICQIVENEVKALDKAIAILDNSNDDKFTGEEDEKDQLYNELPILRRESEEYYHVSSSDNISVLNSSKPAIQFNKTSISPPSVSRATTDTTLTFSTLPTARKTSNGDLNSKVKVSKYDAILAEMKNAKGEKTD